MNNSWVYNISKTYMTEVLNIKKPKVLIVSIEKVWNITENDLAPLKAIADVGWFQTKNLSQEELAERCRGYDHLMLNVDALESIPSKMERIDEKFYNHEGTSGLKSLNQDMTDSDYFSPMIGTKRGLLIQDCPNTATQSVAESTVCEILMHTRKRHLAYMDEMKNKKVECRTGLNLKGKTVGIVGYGSIGSRVGNILTGFGMNVLAHDIKRINIQNTPIEKLFSLSDVISIHTPTIRQDGGSNIGLIDSRLINLCDDAVLVNLATDVVVDPSAAANGLRSGKLSAYSTQSDYSGEYGKKYLKHFKGIDGFHLSPCSFDSPESRENIKRVWIQNTISMIQGNPINLWNKQ